ncbi:MAG: prolyl oligopeptidase family serine peptidase [Verrucomicrobia bacterium]|nr:prolyl oligopeptidase family serine peptidase [Verrucomicrobiota bacterium]
MDGNRRSYGTLAPGARRAQHTYSGHVWLVEDASGKPLGVFEAAETGGEAIIEDGRGTARPKRARSNRPAPPAPRRSRWRARIIDNNVWLESTSAGERVQITRDGSAEDGYREPFYPSPDGRWLVVMKTRKGDDRKVCLIESSPKDRLQPKLHSFAYLKPGDRVPLPRPVLIDLRSRRAIAVSSALCANPYAISRCRWAPDSSEFYFLYNQRGHQLLRLLALNPRTGRVRSVVEERSRTFVDYAHKTYIRFLDKTGELIWMSERDGWNHLYLYDLRTGRIKRQITKGPWAVRRVVRVEPEKRRIWFYAGGVRPGQNPYCLHLCRANFDGSGFRILTEGNGTHEAAFSPDKRFFLDRWSRVDLPPVTELREAESGRLLCVLERADWSALLAAGWSPPEQFVAKGRDGKTDIYGVIYKPSRFDPSRKYPILEEIYAGPQSAYTPTAFGLQIRQHAMAELGFIVVQIDGMGTSWRSRAFHDVCWRNLGDAGIPDRVRWIRAAAARRPYMDLERVGIYGGSAGGQNALRALLVRGDFYKAAVADCGCHDNRMDKLWWNELWMGWPVGPHYAEQSNVTQAHRLQGKLLLMVGELDHNVDPASTYQVVNALIQANKDFELIVQPGVGHGSAETSYGSRRRMDFLVRALWGVEPRSRP